MRIAGYWSPNADDIRKLFDFLMIADQLPSNSCCQEGEQILPVDQYAFQLAGIVIGMREVIYVNAYHLNSSWNGDKPVVACDGGKWLWGAVYDPKADRLSQLAINGDA